MEKIILGSMIGLLSVVACLTCCFCCFQFDHDEAGEQSENSIEEERDFREKIRTYIGEIKVLVLIYSVRSLYMALGV